MKRIVKFLILPLIFILSGCFNNQSMDNITIYTTSYPIEYVTSRLYSNHGTIKSIYPNGIDITNYKLNNALIDEYQDNDLYVFNGLTMEKDYVQRMLKNNKNLKIIDATSDINYNYRSEEIWLDPAKLLSLANNIRKGFNEYVKSNPVITNEVEDNYNILKLELTSLESKYRDELQSFTNTTIVVSNNMFTFLENYGLKVISIDPNNLEYEDNMKQVQSLLSNGSLKYIFTPDYEDNNSSNLAVEKIQLHTLSNLTDTQRENYDYMSLVSENLEILKKQLNSI